MKRHLVAKEGEIVSGKVKMVTIGNKQIGIFQEGGAYYAVLNVCPHARAEVCKGRVSGTLFSSEPGEYEMRHDKLVLRCPWHHWEYYLDTGKAVIPSIRQKLKTYKVIVEDDAVFVEV